MTAAIIEKNERILLAQRKKDSHLGLTWEFPGGKIEGNETPEECLRRELFEEFQVRACIGGLLGTVFYDYDDFVIELMAFKTDILSDEFVLSSHERVKWVNKTELSNEDLTPADRVLFEKIIGDKI